MAVPTSGAELKITSLGTAANRLGRPVKSAKLLGATGSLRWKQEADSLVINCPPVMRYETSVVFKIE